MIYFTADTHFGHENVIRFCDRPFASAEEMDEVMIENWNSRVRGNDTVYILGDMFFRSVNAEEILKRLKGKKCLIVGNHDGSWMTKLDASKYFVSIDKFLEVSDGQHAMTMCHYPLLSWNHAMRTFMIHGHIHNDTRADFWSLIAARDNVLNAGADINGYMPVTFDEMLENNRKFKLNTKTEEEKMFYITGDTHGDFSRYIEFAARMEPTEKDTMIVLGDAGLNYYGNKRDKERKSFVNDFPFTTFCIHGNHEMRPADISTYKTKEYCGGTVWYEDEYPNILFAKDGEIYDFDGYSCIAIGGAYSVDKFYRLERGWMWFDNEQPSDEIKSYVERQLQNRSNKIDVVLSHTCPIKYEPIEVFIRGLDQSTVDKSTEEWLGQIEEKLDYKRWYCGHYHTIKKIDKMQFMFEDIDVLKG